MPLTPFLTAAFAFAAVCALLALVQLARARRCWRMRRRFAAGWRLAWSLVFLLLGLLAGLGGGAVVGYRRLTAQAPVAEVRTRALGAQHYAVTIRFPDGAAREVELAGDEWQLDARVIRWDPRAVVLGAPPLYRLERISGRYRDVAQERSEPRSAVALAPSSALDLWSARRRLPGWFAWVDADYGSAAYLPLVDGGVFTVTLAATGGLVARPADAPTRQKIEAAAW
jgi:hypothetical protein